VEFNDAGTLLASGSDDTHLCLWNPGTRRLLGNQHTGHTANIFCTVFLPGA
jgi:hypothetical protein